VAAAVVGAGSGAEEEAEEEGKRQEGEGEDLGGADKGEGEGGGGRGSGKKAPGPGAFASHNAASAAAKEASRAAAAAIWPKHGALFARRCDHGRAEALLIAAWAAGWSQRRAVVTAPAAAAGTAEAATAGARGSDGDAETEVGATRAPNKKAADAVVTRVWWQQGPLRGSDAAAEARAAPVTAVAGAVRATKGKNGEAAGAAVGEGGGGDD
jgi:hypothetical protein